MKATVNTTTFDIQNFKIQGDWAHGFAAWFGLPKANQKLLMCGLFAGI
jgi:hypothetical protein